MKTALKEAYASVGMKSESTPIKAEIAVRKGEEMKVIVTYIAIGTAVIILAAVSTWVTWKLLVILGLSSMAAAIVTAIYTGCNILLGIAYAVCQ